MELLARKDAVICDYNSASWRSVRFSFHYVMLFFLMSPTIYRTFLKNCKYGSCKRKIHYLQKKYARNGVKIALILLPSSSKCSFPDQGMKINIPKLHLSLCLPRTLPAPSLSLKDVQSNLNSVHPFHHLSSHCGHKLHLSSSFLPGIPPSHRWILPTKILLILQDNLYSYWNLINTLR